MSTNRLHPLLETISNEERDDSVLFRGALLDDEHREANSPVETWRYRLVKRMLDCLGAAFLLLLFAFPGAIIAATILFSSQGRVFYREERIGRYGQKFRIWKFRTMLHEAPERIHVESTMCGDVVLEWRMQKHLHDPRITPIGRFLRNWSLDEIPQLLNVLCGEMSLIGPRPIVLSEAAFYGDYFRYYLCATPGMSGIWQVSGRSGIDYSDRAKLDMHYVRAWSLALDLKILLRTVPAVLKRVGAA